ncbi:MAG: DUF3332 family protein [Thermodesulfobacteriota bacterium]
MITRKIFIGLLIVICLTGCMGQNGLMGKAAKFNLSVVENRYGREGVFICMIPAYLVCSVCDLLIFNSIEFWSGTNPLNGKEALVDTKLIEVPSDVVKNMGFKELVAARIERLNDTQAKLYLAFENGDRATFDVNRDDRIYTVSYGNVEFYKGVLN